MKERGTSNQHACLKLFVVVGLVVCVFVALHPRRDEFADAVTNAILKSANSISRARSKGTQSPGASIGESKGVSNHSSTGDELDDEDEEDDDANAGEEEVGLEAKTQQKSQRDKVTRERNDDKGAFEESVVATEAEAHNATNRREGGITDVQATKNDSGGNDGARLDDNAVFDKTTKNKTVAGLTVEQGQRHKKATVTESVQDKTSLLNTDVSSCPGYSPNVPTKDIYPSVTTFADSFIASGKEAPFDVDLFKSAGLLRLKNAYVYFIDPVFFIRTCHAALRVGGCGGGMKRDLAQVPAKDDSRLVSIDKAIFLPQTHSISYFHWLVESFTRIVLTTGFMYKERQQSRGNLWKVVHSIIGHDYPLLFQLFGFQMDAYIPFSRDSIYLFKDLVIPRNTGCGNPETDTIRKFRAFVKGKYERFLPSAGQESTRKKLPSQMKIVIQSRELYARIIHEEKHRRWIDNRADLEAALRQAYPEALIYDFPKNLDPESIKMPHVLDVHFDADIIIAAHGASLANMLFATSDKLQVVEIHQFSGRNTGPFWSLAHKLGLCYQCIQNLNGGYASAMTVNVTEVMGAVDWAIKNIQHRKVTGTNACLHESRCYNGDHGLAGITVASRQAGEEFRKNGKLPGR